MSTRKPVAQGGIFGAATQRPLSSQTKELLKGNVSIKSLKQSLR